MYKTNRIYINKANEDIASDIKDVLSALENKDFQRLDGLIAELENMRNEAETRLISLKDTIHSYSADLGKHSLLELDNRLTWIGDYVQSAIETNGVLMYLHDIMAAVYDDADYQAYGKEAA